MQYLVGFVWGAAVSSRNPQSNVIFLIGGVSTCNSEISKNKYILLVRPQFIRDTVVCL